MINPIRKLREDKNLTRLAFARAIGVSYQSLEFAENGYPRVLSSPLLAALQEVGAGADLQEKYKTWRESK